MASISVTTVTAAATIACFVSCGGALAAELQFTTHIVATDNVGVRSVSAADLDGDGDLDILTASAEDNRVRWYENDGALHPTFTERYVDSLRFRSNFVFAADIDGDGDLDIVSTSAADSMVAWYENIPGSPPYFYRRIITADPNGYYDDPPGFAMGARQAVTADFDGDGDLDVASASADNDRVAWYENLGGPVPEWTPRIVDENLDGARSIAAADLDGDGDQDLISGPWYASSIMWYENDGQAPTTFIPHVLFTFPPDDLNEYWGHAQVWRVFATDIDRDGDLDVLAARRNNRIELMENLGNDPAEGTLPSFARRILSTTTHIGKSVHAADLDEDGDIDPLSASLQDDKIAWYENVEPAGLKFVQRIIIEDPDGPPPPVGGPEQGVADGARTIWAGDLDGDGDLDVLWGSRHNHHVGWEENLLSCAGDLDGDCTVGATDLAVVLQYWGQKGVTADLDGGGVGISDLLLVINHWGSGQLSP